MNVKKPFQKKKTIENVDWSSDDYFPLLKAAVCVYLNGNTKQASLLTSVKVPQHSLESFADLFRGIMDRGDNAIEFENITVGMVYPKAKKEDSL